MLSKPRALGALGSFRAARAVRAALLGLLTFAIAGIAYPVDARITGLQITSVQSPAFGGASFGNAGQYETLVGTASGEVDPADPLNAIITDIELAPRNARGMVEYSMDVVITKPIDTSRGNGTLLHDVPNRGRIRSPELNVGGNATTIGDGFLESQGYTLVDSGWEGDLTTGLRIALPIARNPDGTEITGPVRSEYIVDEPTVDAGRYGSTRLRIRQSEQCRCDADQAHPSGRREGAHFQQRLGVCRLHFGAVPRCSGYDEGVPEGRFRYQPHLRVGIHGKESHGDGIGLRRDP